MREDILRVFIHQEILRVFIHQDILSVGHFEGAPKEIVSKLTTRVKINGN